MIQRGVRGTKRRFEVDGSLMAIVNCVFDIDCSDSARRSGCEYKGLEC